MSIDIRVPDIGDFKDVPVIEIYVKVGDTVKAEDPLVSLESDKAHRLEIGVGGISCPVGEPVRRPCGFGCDCHHGELRAVYVRQRLQSP